MPAKVLLVNGPNLNMLGSREPEIYGKETLPEIEVKCEKAAKALKLALDCYQSNIEGEIVSKIQHVGKQYQGLIINAGAYSHTSIAIMDALMPLKIPVIEVHLSNIFRREEFRHESYISKAAKGIICGLGSIGYILALEALADILKKKMSIWKIGHRGACGYAPENTLASIRKAIELGAHGFEFDIQMSKDGEPVVIHDDTLDRTTNGKGEVHHYTLKELQQFDAGNKQFPGEYIPSLRNVLDMVDKRCRLFIEIKAEHATKSVADIITHYVAKLGWNYEQLFACSFDHGQVAEIRRFNPNIRTGAIIAGIPVSLAEIASEAGAWSINPCIHHINSALVKDAHARGLKVLTWTANESTHIAKAKALAVDGIFSDYPDRI